MTCKLKLYYNIEIEVFDDNTKSKFLMITPRKQVLVLDEIWQWIEAFYFCVIQLPTNCVHTFL